MAITVTATQGGSTANGLLLRVYVLTGAKKAGSQAGAAPSANVFSSSAFTVAGTITATSSAVYGAVVHTNGTTNTATGVTIVDDVNDSTNGERYTTFKQTAPSSGSQTLGVTASANDDGGVAWLEVQASGTIAEDASAPASQPFTATSATTVSSGSFTPVGGSLLVALVSSDGGTGVTTMTVSGGGYTWTEITHNAGTGTDYCGVWIADVPAASAPVPPAAPGPAWLARFRGQHRKPKAPPQFTAPAAVPAAGPVFYPQVQAVRARQPLTPQNASARISSSPGAPVRNPTQGPVFYAAPQPCRPRIPQNIQPAAARISSSPGAPPRNPTTGPPFRQATRVITAVDDRRPSPRGRCYSNPGAPVSNPAPPRPVFAVRPAPVRYALPPWHPPAGRVGFNKGAPVANPIRGPAFSPPPVPARARQPLPVRGRTTSSPVQAAAAPTAGPRFYQAAKPCRSRIPQNAPRGRASGNPGGPVANANVIGVYGAVPGPVRASLPAGRRGRVTVAPAAAARTAPVPARFFPAVQALRARLPQMPFLRGRSASNPGAPARNPVSGPVFRQATQPAGARQPLPRRGRTVSNPGAPVRNPSAGPVFRQSTTPARARQLLPPRGRAWSSPGGRAGAPTSGPPVYGQAQGAVAVRWAGRSRAGSSASSPVQNITIGPVFAQATRPVKTRLPYPPPKGRAVSSVLVVPVPVPNVAPVTGATPGAVRAALPVHLRGTVTSSRIPAQAAPPATGPVFRQASQPARIRPALPRRGRVNSNPGVLFLFTAPGVSSGQPAGIRVISLYAGRTRSTQILVPPSAPSQGPVFRPVPHPAQARVPLPPRGRVTSNPGGTPRNPVPGPVFRQAAQPARARQPLPLRGRTWSNPGTPVTSAPAVGPPFYPFRQAVHIRFTLPPKGRVASSRGAAVRNPVPGAAFPAWHGPVQARQPLPPRGRAWSSPGGQVKNPPSSGPVIPQRGQPAQARFPLPPRGRTGSNAGAPARNPSPGPLFRQALQAARARLPQQPFLKGRAAFNPGAPVQNPSRGPVFVARPWPARPRNPQLQPRAGRCYSNPGAPVSNPSAGSAFTQAVQPPRARLPVPFLKGRAASNPGAPVRNVSRGPVFYPLHWPARKRIPQNAPRGRTFAGKGAPVQNIPQTSPVVRTGTPYLNWATDVPYREWDTAGPYQEWSTGTPYGP